MNARTVAAVIVLAVASIGAPATPARAANTGPGASLSADRPRLTRALAAACTERAYLRHRHPRP